jgi:hypothetical protein
MPTHDALSQALASGSFPDVDQEWGASRNPAIPHRPLIEKPNAIKAGVNWNRLAIRTPQPRRGVWIEKASQIVGHRAENLR